MGKLIFDQNSDLYQEFWHLWTQEREHLLLLCNKWMGNPEEAEDALSSAMIKAWEKLPRFQDKIINLRAWLTRFIYNHCMDIHRSRRREPNLDHPIEDLVGREREGPGMQESPEEELVRREMFNHLRAAIRDLPTSLRQPISLRLFRELPYREIAKELNMSPENARKRVQRARRMLSRQLEELPGGLQDLDESIPESELIGEETRVSEIPLPGNFAHARHNEVGESWRWMEVRPGRLEQKCTTLKKYVEAHPGGWRKRFELAETLVALGRANAATEHLIGILGKRPETHQARLLLFGLFLESGRHEAAAGVATAGGTHSQQSETRIFFEGLRRYASGDLPDAIDALREAFLLSPSKVSSGWWLARLFLELEAHSEAFDVLAHLKEENQHCNPINFLLLQEHLRHGRTEAARAVIRALRPDDMSQAAFSLIEGRFVWVWFPEDREKLLRHLSRNYPGHRETLRAQALVSLVGDRKGRIEQNLRNALRKSADPMGIRLVWVEQALWQGEYPKIWRWIRQNQTVGAELALRLAELLSGHRLPKDVAQRVVAWLHPLQGWRKYTWGSQLLGQIPGREDQALRWAFEGRDLQPRLVRPWWAAGNLLFKVGRKSEALDFFRNARERCGSSDHALRAFMCLEIAGVYQSVGDTEAERYLREIERDLPSAAFELPGMRKWVESRIAFLRGDEAQVAVLSGQANALGLPFPYRSIGH